MTHIPFPTFTTVHLREGYNVAEVDDFVARVLRELSGPLPNGDLAHRIRSATFTPVRLRRGYDMGEVDTYLDALGSYADTGRRPT